MNSGEISKVEREEGSRFLPNFGADGLLTAIVTDAQDGTVLMVAHMNGEALEATLESMEAHFYSRSRSCLWKKGETSGNVLKVEEILVDCDQDALVLKVQPAGPACHTGARSCFYRLIEDGSLQRVSD
ncbi:phosphoribosyl-AMP cyclohydrolase [Altererythrobacter sp. MF3-039]|uniref:phosphoribosyl-AMP cyclohydrolase n=1 Tax=Altererythrobacter sp. MF3-039 TaxID=3252901 RepID=UPI00390CA282